MISPAESFVTGFYVGEVQISKQVRKKRQELVGHIMAEVQDARSAPGQEARPKDHVSLAIFDRLDQPGDVDRVVLQVGILHDDNLARAGGEAGPQRRGFALVRRLANQAHARDLLAKFLDDLRRVVLRAIVDHDRFVQVGDFAEQCGEHRSNGFFLVISRDNDRLSHRMNP